ncbi:hypothetical protein PIB30_060045, partial [Stylosanthes scabra]|nr:hypothetical protein [Stylosanthes scabra]
RRRDLPHEDDHFDHPRPRSSCMRAIAYRCFLARGANSQSVVRQTDRVLHAPVLPVRTHGFPSRMLRSDGTEEDAVEASPPPVFSILPSDEQTTPISPLTMYIPDVSGSTVPHMSSVSTPERPA